jgi:hypothetical protein
MAERIARLVTAVAGRHPLRCRCLERSTTLWWLLARAGVPARVVLGVRKDGTGVEAHAWVEVNGVSVGEPEGLRDRFQPLGRRVDPLSAE